MSLTDNQRAALRIMTASLRGQSLSTMIARGFAFEMLQELVRAGLATAIDRHPGPAARSARFGDLAAALGARRSHC
jgi:hypothetical protein